MNDRHHSRRRLGLRAVVGACCGSIALVALGAAYLHEPGGSTPPGSVALPTLPTEQHLPLPPSPRGVC